jgi:hypothetical protein
VQRTLLAHPLQVAQSLLDALRLELVASHVALKVKFTRELKLTLEQAP